jgi:hypothetical protein
LSLSKIFPILWAIAENLILANWCLNVVVYEQDNMSLNTFEQLIKEFGQTLGLPELALDEEARCHLVVDEEILISFEFQADEQRLLLSAPIGDPSELGSEELLKHLLVSNLTAAAMGEPVAGLEPTTQTLLLVHRVSTDHLDNAALQTEVENFIAFVEHWHSEIRSDNWNSGVNEQNAPNKPSDSRSGQYMSV